MKIQFLIATLLIVAGCSSRGAYEGIQASNRIECSKRPPSQYEECMTNANTSYDEYKRKREAAINQ